MNRLIFTLLGALSLSTAVAQSLAGLTGSQSDPALQRVVDQSVARTLAAPHQPVLTPRQLAVTVVDLADPSALRWASHRGTELIYPASVVKLFYLVAVHRWLEDGRLTDTPELRRAMKDMIVESYNEATHYLVDLLTGTTSGPELTDDALRTWWEQRNAVNRYLESLGYTRINVSKKPWCEGPYGRESQAIARFEPRRNWLTTEATARLLTEIALRRAVSSERSRQMLELLARDPRVPGDPEDQAHGFTALALPPGAKLWSKAGWTSETRHDAALLELPNGRRLITVVFTTGHANDREILPSIVRGVLESWPARETQP